MLSRIVCLWAALAAVACAGVDDREPGLAFRDENPQGTGGNGTAPQNTGATATDVNPLLPAGTGGTEGPPSVVNTNIPGVEPVMPVVGPEPIGPVLELVSERLDFGGG